MILSICQWYYNFSIDDNSAMDELNDGFIVFSGILICLPILGYFIIADEISLLTFILPMIMLLVELVAYDLGKHMTKENQ